MSAAAGACSLSDLSGAGDPASRDAGDGSPPGYDGAPFDSSPPSDADIGATDAGPSDDASSSPCKPGVHDFCDDFDHDEGGAFAQWNLTPGSGITLYDEASTSPPYSADVRCDGGAPCWMQTSFRPAAGLKFQLRVRLVSVDQEHGIWEIVAGQGQKYVAATIRSDRGTYFSICDNTGCSHSTPLPTPSTSAFQAISGELRFADGGSIDVSVDGQPLVKGASPVGFDAADGVIFGIGDSFVVGGSSELLVDDVVIDTF